MLLLKRPFSSGDLCRCAGGPTSLVASGCTNETPLCGGGGGDALFGGSWLAAKGGCCNAALLLLRQRNTGMQKLVDEVPHSEACRETCTMPRSELRLCLFHRPLGSSAGAPSLFSAANVELSMRPRLSRDFLNKAVAVGVPSNSMLFLARLRLSRLCATSVRLSLLLKSTCRVSADFSRGTRPISNEVEPATPGDFAGDRSKLGLLRKGSSGGGGGRGSSSSFGESSRETGACFEAGDAGAGGAAGGGEEGCGGGGGCGGGTSCGARSDFNSRSSSGGARSKCDAAPRAHLSMEA